ncbi:MAG: caspase family protein [Bacteroidetes bacterium]|nr:caspase family protein [Bacteroidota bacterium]
MKNLFPFFLLLLAYAASAQQPETLIQLGHSDRVRCVSVTPDAKFAVTGSGDNTIKLWNISNGQLIRTFNGHHGLVYAVQISNDGKSVYSCSWDDKRTIKWDALTGKILKQYINYASPVSVIALSHDTKLLACAAPDGVLILNTSDFTLRRKIIVAKPTLIKFSPEDTRLYIATDEYKKEMILCYSISNGMLLNSLPSLYGAESFDLSNDKIVVSNYKEIICLNLNSKQKIYSIAKDSLKITTVCMNKIGHMIAYGLEDGTILTAMLDGTLLKDVNGTIVKFEKKHTGILNQLQFSDDDKFLITASNDWTSKVFSVNTGKVVRNLTSRSEYIQSLCLSGSGNFLSFTSGHLETGNHIGVWDLQRGKLFPFYPKEEVNSFFSQVAFSPRNKTIAAANINGNLSWYSFPYNGNMGKMTIGDAPVTCVAITPNGKNYLAGTKEGKLIFWRPDRNKSETIEADKSGIASLGISPDARAIALGTLDGKLLLYDYESKTILRKIESHSANTGYYDTSNVMAYGSVTSMSMDGHFAQRYASIMSVAFSADSKLIAACGGNWIKIYDAGTGQMMTHIKVYGAGFCTLNFSADGKYLCSGGADFKVRIYETSNGALLKTFVGHQNEVRSVLFSANQKYLISGSLDTQIKIWDIVGEKELLSYVVMQGGEDYVITNPQGYYYATKGAAKVLSFRIGNEIYPFEQFDLKYNRPDIILNDISKLAFANEKNNQNVPLIKSYYVAYQKRLKRAGFEESELGSTFHVPTITLNGSDLPLSTKHPWITFKIKAEDNLYQLKSVNIWVNDVPVYGVKGMLIRGKSYDGLSTIELGSEKNKITVSCMNEKGVESYKESFEIVFEGGEINYKTYFIGVGISHYKNSDFNLKYAAKDVTDLSKMLEPKNVTVVLLTDENATKENILKVKELLMKTSVNDKVILSLSGHGLLSKDLDFYYATYDVDFGHPETNGLLYDDLESILDGIPARNKLLLVDACHSGEVDKSENIQVADGPPKPGVSGISAKGSALILDSASIGLDNSFELMQDLFSDISNGNGAIVISAAGGKEYALESDQWNNGVFTYCVLNALKNGAADTNQDKKTTVVELKNYVSSQVQSLTGGKQKPTSRKENLENNWEVWDEN